MREKYWSFTLLVIHKCDGFREMARSALQPVKMMKEGGNASNPMV